MLKEPYLQDIPDDLPATANPELEPGEVAEIEGLHAHVKRMTQELQRRRQEFFDKYQGVLDMNDAPRIRLNLLIQHGLGVLTKPRLEMEAHFLQIQLDAISEGTKRATAPQAKELHLANGQVVHVNMDEVDQIVKDLQEGSDGSERPAEETD